MRYSGGWGLPTIKQGLGRGGGVRQGDHGWKPDLGACPSWLFAVRRAELFPF